MSKPVMYITRLGTKIWENSLGEFHSLDGPAVERKNGTKEWWQNGKRHRTDGPAIEYADGTKFWYQNGNCHREDGPAVEYKSGLSGWYYKNDFLGNNLKGFWRFWERLDEEGRQNVNLHMWLARLTNN